MFIRLDSPAMAGIVKMNRLWKMETTLISKLLFVITENWLKVNFLHIVCSLVFIYSVICPLSIHLELSSFYLLSLYLTLFILANFPRVRSVPFTIFTIFISHYVIFESVVYVYVIFLLALHTVCCLLERKSVVFVAVVGCFFPLVQFNKTATKR